MTDLSALRLLASVMLITITTAFLRLLYILPLPVRARKTVKPIHGTAHAVIVLGSGGHTAEMMSLCREIDPRRYARRTYILSSGDNFSAGKASEIEDIIQSKCSSASGTTEVEYRALTGTWECKIVPRARQIHQPLYTTPFSSLWSLLKCIQALMTCNSPSDEPFRYPDVLITNGPATAVMVILAALILKFFAIAPASSMKIVYVESWARVRTLSLSGKILLQAGICDRFLVQWDTLADSINGNRARKRVECLGFLVD